MLLRVSSNQQLESDGDLSIQRQILLDYIHRQSEWILNDKEYFEGSKSAYKNTSKQRDILQEILQDAKDKQFDILVPYKDDRVGRLMWDTPLYIMSLKQYGVDVFTAKEGCITPDPDDIMGQMMLAFRYGNAQKSSADTGQRVKDTAEKLVKNGKFMGGSAPYGYELLYSGEISKHGRALKHLVIVPEQARVVKHIYDLSLNKELGSAKIAKELNTAPEYKSLAPNDFWRESTITSILTNPIYTGHTAYKRRERKNGKYLRLDISDWVISSDANEDILIIDAAAWNKTQMKRKMRGRQYQKGFADTDATVIKRNDAVLPLIDVIHCGYCGRKLVNGSKYNYWTLKESGEKRTSKTTIYKCQNAGQGIPHAATASYRADKIEPMIFDALAGYVEKLQAGENILVEIMKNQDSERAQKEKELVKAKRELQDTNKKLSVMKSNIPNAMTGEYPLSLEELVAIINEQKGKVQKQSFNVQRIKLEIQDISADMNKWEVRKGKTPTWQNVFLNADTETKRVIINRLIKRIDVKEDEIRIHFKISPTGSFMPS